MKKFSLKNYEIPNKCYRLFNFRSTPPLCAAILLCFDPVVAAFSEPYTCANPDDGLSAVEKLEKYAASENIFNR